MPALRSHSIASTSGLSSTSRRPSTILVRPSACSISNVGKSSPRNPVGSLSTISKSGSYCSTADLIRPARIAVVSSIPMPSACEIYDPSAILVTPGSRIWSTRSGKVNRPATGEPVRMMAVVLGSAAVIALASARERRKCPRPNVSWLYSTTRPDFCGSSCGRAGGKVAKSIISRSSLKSQV